MLEKTDEWGKTRGEEMKRVGTKLNSWKWQSETLTAAPENLDNVTNHEHDWRETEGAQCQYVTR